VQPFGDALARAHALQLPVMAAQVLDELTLGLDEFAGGGLGGGGAGESKQKKEG